ncbi:unnamed protein product [Porites lobata]|uniref:Reverse transcriptase n=1 Tax=Porites lobata TaxID=104759 RepID=A0ABN8Q389_9CNID|nr:unnamed protein product [Porites lobata]
MINDSKTEFMLTGTKAQLQKTKSSTLTIGESIISPSTEPLRNLGAWFDCNFNLNFNITKTSCVTLPTLGDRAFVAAAPKLWNNLPLDLRCTSDFQVFKRDLKTHLFKKAFSDIML